MSPNLLDTAHPYHEYFFIGMVLMLFEAESIQKSVGVYPHLFLFCFSYISAFSVLIFFVLQYVFNSILCDYHLQLFTG